MAKYSPARIEKHWQKYWATKKLFVAKDRIAGKQNLMILVEFPYPSGNLHMGHWYAFALPDMYARYWRMRGHNVMYPIGFDAFGLPAENAAIQRDIHPEQWTKQNIAFMTGQMESMGTMFDWSRVVSTIDPAYYRWTQWMFLRMFEKGLAYRAKTRVNWCPKDQTVLANEQVVDGHCERCGTEVDQRALEQWMLKTTAYADRLIDEMKDLDWPETTKTAQRNWIGRSEGAVIQFKVIKSSGHQALEDLTTLEVFTTRPDTIFGATFLVVSSEKAGEWISGGWDAPEHVRSYIKEALGKRELERQEEKEKTGADTGLKAVNPLSGEKIPIWVADYVLGSYGTGAIMAVPAHDERDRAFAEAFGLPISDAPLRDAAEILVMLGNINAGRAEKQYRLRDWVLSRQRYWGVPMPLIYCRRCAEVQSEKSKVESLIEGRDFIIRSGERYAIIPVSDKDLPVKLPPLEDFRPADDGRSPLAKAEKWLRVKCPKCGGPAERETDTMDTFVDSSWYFLRYTDPKNKKKFADAAKMKAWLPVPIYIGGAEHNTMHLLYSRFFTKALHDLGYLDFDEPFVARHNHGIILGPDGQKMSKSRGNVVDPDKEVAQYGADAVRMYLAFMGPYEQGGPWNPKGITGVYRFLTRVWNLYTSPKSKLESPKSDESIERALHLATKNIGADVEALSLNTCISELMKLLNTIEDADATLTAKQREHFLLLVAPFASHMAEELWQTILKKKTSIHLESWPDYDPKLLVEDTVRVPVQVNGKVRDVIVIPPDMREDDAVFAAKQSEHVARHLEGATIRKIIYLPGKMLNIVVG